MKKKLIILIIFVLAFAFTTTAFASVGYGELVDTASWNSTTCLYGFTTTYSVDKASSEEWEADDVIVTKLVFNNTPQYNYLLATPKTTSGLTMGGQTQASTTNIGESQISSTYSKSYNSIKLRIDNPNSGNNMGSHGSWEGYVYFL